MDILRQDLRYAVRALTRQPGFTLTIVLCLGIGIGANATMFGVVDTLLLRPPPHVQDAGRVVRPYVIRSAPAIGEMTSGTFSYPDYVDLRDQGTAFSGVAAFSKTDISLGRGADARKIDASLVTHTFFPLLGVQPALGRFFTAEEDQPPDGASVAVLSYELWQRDFAGDPGVVGEEIVLGRDVFTVIGVAPPRFTGVDLDRMDVWLPISTAPAEFMGIDAFGSRNFIWIRMVGRLRPGASVELANQQATAIFRRAYAEDEHVDPEARVTFASVLPARGPEGSREATISLWLAGVAAIVLLIACANVANLLLTRGLNRQREIAVRLALGVRRGRLIRQLLTESLVLAFLGAIAGLLVASWGGGVIRLLLAPNIPALDTPLSDRVLAFSAAVALTTGLLCGIVPALQASRPDLTTALKSGAREGSGRHHSKVRFALQVGQVALSFVLLIGAGLFIRSLWNVRSVDLGIDADRVLVAQMGLEEHGYSAEEIDALYHRMLAEIEALPGVDQASIAVGTPFRFSFSNHVVLPGRDSLPQSSVGGPYVNAVTPGFLGTLGTAILRGRGLTPADHAEAPQVAVINEAMARLYWPGEEAIGQCFRIGPEDPAPCRRVVGIVETARRNELREEPNPQFYVPLEQYDELPPLRALFVRTHGDPRTMIGTVRQAMQSLGSSLPYADVQVMQDLVEPQIRPWRVGATMFGVFGAVALVIAVVGLYGVLAYGVTQRRHEIGVRLALGAGIANVVGLVARHAIAMVAVGILLGGLAALAAGRVLASQLFGISASDPAVFTFITIVLLTAAAVAAYLPARRAARVDPMIALRSE